MPCSNIVNWIDYYWNEVVIWLYGCQILTLYRRYYLVENESFLDVRSWRCIDVWLWRYIDVWSWRWIDVRSWRCIDVRSWRCIDVRSWRCIDVWSWRCIDVRIWRLKNFHFQPNIDVYTTSGSDVFTTSFWRQMFAGIHVAFYSCDSAICSSFTPALHDRARVIIHYSVSVYEYCKTSALGGSDSL